MFSRFRAEVDRTFSSWRKESKEVSTEAVVVIAEVVKATEPVSRTLATFNELSVARIARRNREIARRS